MPGPSRRRGVLALKAVEAGELSDEDVTCAAANVVRLIERATTAADMGDAVDDVDAAEVAYRAAVGSLVLLANRGVLPLPPGARIAVIGASAEPGEIQGGGSAG